MLNGDLKRTPFEQFNPNKILARASWSYWDETRGMFFFWNNWEICHFLSNFWHCPFNQFWKMRLGVLIQGICLISYRKLHWTVFDLHSPQIRSYVKFISNSFTDNVLFNMPVKWLTNYSAQLGCHIGIGATVLTVMLYFKYLGFLQMLPDHRPYTHW